jgi:hypothetical protein
MYYSPKVALRCNYFMKSVLIDGASNGFQKKVIGTPHGTI